ncbi:MHYT domain-containing protein [Phaeobacter sp. B1627]|uniref:MHYT domain-containing protein n=1 Tax=Phaeobacter sp. B1627 TaxID=2583809 RepID=UPI00111893FE|nr:MHYT domain-containing protein [Phaeobacter sp. B1627]TNJ48638.1 carbon monoxide dehydrogenase [Phaeobacter sp. B1627]
MESLQFTHNALLVLMSCIVALAAGFTGLSLTRNLSQKTVTQRKFSVALAAVALGGGIWSMHFVAMLGLQLPVLFFYDAAITLISALTAILIVGAALILLHFTKRTPQRIALAGTIVGAGVLVMHYIGMAGLELCRAIYTPFGIIVSSGVAIGLCILAFGVAYGQRTNRNIFLGTLCFAVAVCAVHFLAMAGTRFVSEAPVMDFGPSMSNEVLALGVILSSFVIFGAFLLVSITYLVPVATTDAEPLPPREAALPQPTGEFHIPCERDGTKVFVPFSDVAIVRADGHYTQIYTERDRLFCAWPITEATKRLLPAGFLQTHRSYLINPAKVAQFERTKDKGRCIFEATGLPPAPVSRSKLQAIQDALTLPVGATRAG